MKHTLRTPSALAAAAALLALPAAHAQSSIKISGLIDIGVYRDTGKMWNVGPIQRSNIAFSGSEDLGGGLAAIFKLSHRFSPDTGGLESATKPFWHGESTVGLMGAFGTLQFGRRLDAINSQDWRFDPWYNFDRIASPAWDTWHYNFPSDPTGNSGTAEYGRLDNGIFYDSPEFNGFSFHLSASPEKATPDDEARPLGVTLNYNSDRLSVMLARSRNSADNTDTFVGGRVNVAPFSVMAVYNVSKAGGSEAKAVTTAVEYLLGATTLKAGWGRVRLDGRQAVNVLGAGASYPLSKRTALYADAARKKFGSDSSNTYGVGIAHSF